MKVILFYIGILMSAVPVMAQDDPDTISKDQDTIQVTGMGRRAMPEVLARPAFETTNGGLNLKIWIMSVIKGMNNNEMNNVTGVQDEEEGEPGTHHVMVEIKSAENGKEIPGAVVKLLSVSPSGKKSSADLETMMNQYGGNILLEEKGEYQLSVNVTAEGESIVTPFKYTIR